MPDVLLTLLPVLGALVVVWLGHLLQRGREHNRWLKEQRLELYTEALNWVDEYERNLSKPVEHERMRSTLYPIANKLTLLGPPSISDQLWLLIAQMDEQARITAFNRAGYTTEDEWRAKIEPVLNRITAVSADLKQSMTDQIQRNPRPKPRRKEPGAAVEKA